jgi:predicted DCC family thiol-disulfide oxidoreductase YuxK
MEPFVPQPIWLFWDRECGFCERAIAWVKQRDATDQIQAVPYQEAPRPPMTDILAQRCERAVQVVTQEGDILSAGRACLYVLEKVGYPRLARVWRLRPLIWCIEIDYWLVARNRQFFGRWLFRTGGTR